MPRLSEKVQGDYFYSLKFFSFWNSLQNQRELAVHCAICGPLKMVQEKMAYTGVPKMTSPAFPLLLFLLFSFQMSGICLQDSWWVQQTPRVLVEGGYE